MAKELNLDPKRYPARQFQSMISNAKNELLGPQDYLNAEDSNVAFRVLQKFEELVEAELSKVPERLNNLQHHSHLKVFPLSEPMLERQASSVYWCYGFISPMI